MISLGDLTRQYYSLKQQGATSDLTGAKLDVAARIRSIMSPVLQSLPTYQELVHQRQSGLARLVTDKGIMVPVKVLFANEDVIALTDEQKRELSEQRKKENDVVRFALEEYKVSDHTPIVRIDHVQKTINISYNILWKCKYEGKGTPNNGFLEHEPNIGVAIARQKQGLAIAHTISSSLHKEGYATSSIRVQELNRFKDFIDPNTSKESAWKKYVHYLGEIEKLYSAESDLFLGSYPISSLRADAMQESLLECEVLTFVPKNKGAEIIELPKGCVRLKPTNCQIVKMGNEYFVNVHLNDDKFNGKRPFGSRDIDTVEDFTKIVELAGKAQIHIAGDLNKVEGEEAAGLDANCSNDLETLLRHEMSSLVAKLNDRIGDRFKVSFNPIPGSYYNGHQCQAQSPDWFIEITPLV
jgi:hypothetical protein